MKTTRYFNEQVLRKRPYIERQWCIDTVTSPVRREIQADGRIRHWGRITGAQGSKTRYLRVITLADGETIHNAFFDRNFEENRP